MSLRESRECFSTSPFLNTFSLTSGLNVNIVWSISRNHKLTKLRIFCFSEIDGNFQVFWLVKTQKQNEAIGQRQSSCAVCLLYRVTSSLALSFGSIFGSWYFLILGQNWLQKIEDNFIFKSFNFCQAKVRIWSNTRDITVKVITIKWVRKIPKIRAITY